jgi:hypothetical protein
MRAKRQVTMRLIQTSRGTGVFSSSMPFHW